MAKFCPIIGSRVLYTECLECEEHGRCDKNKRNEEKADEKEDEKEDK